MQKVHDYWDAPAKPTRLNVTLALTIVGLWFYLGSGILGMILEAPFAALIALYTLLSFGRARRDPALLAYYRKVLTLCVISIFCVNIALALMGFGIGRV